MSRASLPTLPGEQRREAWLFPLVPGEGPGQQAGRARLLGAGRLLHGLSGGALRCGNVNFMTSMPAGGLVGCDLGRVGGCGAALWVPALVPFKEAT